MPTSWFLKCEKQNLVSCIRKLDDSISVRKKAGQPNPMKSPQRSLVIVNITVAPSCPTPLMKQQLTSCNILHCLQLEPPAGARNISDPCPLVDPIEFAAETDFIDIPWGHGLGIVFLFLQAVQALPKMSVLRDNDWNDIVQQLTGACCPNRSHIRQAHTALDVRARGHSCKMCSWLRYWVSGEMR